MCQVLRSVIAPVMLSCPGRSVGRRDEKENARRGLMIRKTKLKIPRVKLMRSGEKVREWTFVKIDFVA